MLRYERAGAGAAGVLIDTADKRGRALLDCATRETLQNHFGAATLQANPEEYLGKDFAALAETMALAAGMKLTSENQNVPSGLE